MNPCTSKMKCTAPWKCKALGELLKRKNAKFSCIPHYLHFLPMQLSARGLRISDHAAPSLNNQTTSAHYDLRCGLYTKLSSSFANILTHSLPYGSIILTLALHRSTFSYKNLNLPLRTFHSVSIYHSSCGRDGLHPSFLPCRQRAPQPPLQLLQPPLQLLQPFPSKPSYRQILIPVVDLSKHAVNAGLPSPWPWRSTRGIPILYCGNSTPSSRTCTSSFIYFYISNKKSYIPSFLE